MFRWGIISTGSIANRFVKGAQSLPDTTVLAVGSRTQDTAEVFGERHGIERRYASYEALVADPDLDAIYIATPHPFHHENCLLCLEAGVPVLCEKPFTMNAAELEEVVALARAKQLFLMEGMWSRFMPATVRLHELLDAGVIGELQLLDIDFGFRAGFNPEGRLFAPALGGGALLDIGVYTLSFASMVLGPPQRIASMAHLGESGVDENAAMILGYEGGALTTISAAIRTSTPQRAVLNGTLGRITLQPPFWFPEHLTLEVYGKETTEMELPMNGNGFNHEAAEVARCMAAGQLESEIMPLDESLALMRTMDEIRAQWGLRYPMEEGQ